MVSDRERLVSAWRAEHQRPVVGWDFSELAGRYVEQQPPWSYDDLARDVLTGAKSSLDMGTGGGEVLSRLLDVLPADTMATEGWPPNLPVARAALEPHRVEVVAYDAERDRSMPFDDGRFDVVLNRYEAYDAAEVHRILGSGGRFLTQQVDGRDFEETQQLFGHHSAYPHITPAKLGAQAEAAGLVVDQT
jgi:SAM-dependent methyltransferase